MNVFTYVIEHDLGFAPNPFHGFCTLACCKPSIRKKAVIGDYIIGMGAVKPKLKGHISYWMRVDEIVTFDEYWNAPRFRRKKPIMPGSTYLRYGDNIYHRDEGGDYKQQDSFHSLEDGQISLGDMRRDTGRTDKVLISREFAYWGRSGIELPGRLKCFSISGPGHWSNFTDQQIQTFMDWLGEHPQRGFLDEPAHWQFLDKKKRKVRKALVGGVNESCRL